MAVPRDVALAPLGRLTDRQGMVPGYVWTGRGCRYDCFYCLENTAWRTARRRAAYSDATGHGCAPRSVARDVEQLQQHSQLILDYEHPSDGRTLRFMNALLERLPARITSCDHFHWGLPSPALLNLLSARFDHVGICLDVQAFAELHRRQLATQRLIKPCFDDRALQDVPSHAEDCGNIDVDAAGIVGMPFETPSHRERRSAI